MATTNSLKFYRKSTAPSSPVAGAIWFNTTDKTIQIYTGTEWEKYAGNLKDATWSSDKKTLTITKHDGSSIALDFSDMASASAMTSAIARLDKAITDGDAAAKGYADTQVNAAKEAIIGDSSDTAASSTIAGAKKYADSLASNYDAAGSAAAAQTAAQSYADGKFQVKGNYETAGAAAQALTDAKTYADGKAGEAVAAAENYIDAAIANLDNVAASKNNDLVTVTVTQTDGVVAKVEVATTGIATTTAVEDAIKALDADKTGESTDKHVKVQVTEVDGKLNDVVVTTNDIASAATLAEVKGTVDAFFAGADISETANQYKDTLKELQTYLTEDAAAAATMAGNIAANKTDVRTLATSTVNGHAIGTVVEDKIVAQTIVLNGSEIKLDGYAKNSSHNVAIATTDTINAALGKLEAKADKALTDASNAAAAGVTSLNGNTGAVTIASGDKNGAIKVGGTDVGVKGLKSAAFTDSSAYATAAQGGKADTAVQNVTVTAATGYNANKEIVTVTKGNDNAINLAFNFANISEIKAGQYLSELPSGGPLVRAAVVSEIFRALDDAKADKATTLAGYGITDAYTKTEVDALLCWAEF